MLKLFAAAASFAAVLPLQAVGNTPACAERDKIVDRLKGKYSESHRATGLQNDTKLVEIWTSADSGSWTILVTDVHGKSCIAAAGKGWLDLPTGEPLGKAS